MSPRIRIAEGRRLLRAHPQVADLLLALLLLAVGVPQLVLAELPETHAERLAEPDARNVAIVVATTLALTWRRRAPTAVLLWTTGGELTLAALGYLPSSADVGAFLVSIYTVAAHRGLARSALGGLVAFAAFNVMLLLHESGISLMDYITDGALLAGMWALGRNLRLRRAYLAELEDRAERLERARGTGARAARMEERSRIARELHDVVAHHVSVMTVQAGAARRILDRDPDNAREALATIEEVGRTALSEMRRIVGVLRTDRDPEQAGGELSPQPGVADLGELVEHVRETGLAVQLWIEGEARPLSPGVDLAAFRLVQEALTNTLKHAGPQARAWVRLRYTETDLTVEVEDNGRGAQTLLSGDRDRPGHGLVGMYERVALYGGELRIGPRVGGGFGVRARFPLDA
ncbi:sensor histidine kinase [Thermomonospora catenispora]|uniref:sensor histidine kinase n=1 Tax=Thermomonospora catenispora TaxID=2493090 RepID=UPI0011216A74|nr:sensor histidine kinase [Thermomonospora catenispora]TNY37444.1 sensor histidine kinase [Thermomonospora catenispora]